MVVTGKRLRRSVIKLSVAAFTFASIGVAAAAPFLAHPVVVAKSEIGQLQLRPLSAGPAIMLAKAAPGEAEDCVRVTHVTGPDGKDYPTRGIVCAND